MWILQHTSWQPHWPNTPTEALFILHYICNTVTCSTHISISALITALQRCNKVNWRCNALCSPVVDISVTQLCCSGVWMKLYLYTLHTQPIHHNSYLIEGCCTSQYNVWILHLYNSLSKSDNVRTNAYCTTGHLRKCHTKMIVIQGIHEWLVPSKINKDMTAWTSFPRLWWCSFFYFPCCFNSKSLFYFGFAC